MMKGSGMLFAAIVFAVLLGFAPAWAEDGHTHWAYCDQIKSGCVCAECGKTVGAEELEIIHYASLDPKYEYDQTEHWRKCPVCGEKTDLEAHMGACDQPGVCGICGAKDVKLAFTAHAFERLEYNDAYHWWVCKRCGEKDQNTHWADCGAPDVCVICGVKGVRMAFIAHDYDWDHMKYDGLSHWQVCKKCGETTGREVHWAYCDAPDVCAECGAKNVTIDHVDHDVAWEDVRHDNDSHWWLCSVCGVKVDEYEHWANCDHPDRCADCGAENVQIEYIAHAFELKHDDACHWWACSVCGEIRNKSGHIVYCTDPAVCGVCGVPYRGEVFHINHDPDAYMVYNEMYHQFVCENGHGLILEKHDFIDGVCQKCGYGQKAVLKGDANGDGAVDGRDVLRLVRYLAGTGVTIDWEAADVNGDGNVDGRDVLRLAKQLAGS